MVRPGHVVLGAVGLAVGVLGVGALREATLSTHEEVEPGSETAVLVRAEERGSEPGQSLDEMVEAALGACRLEVSSDLVGHIEPLGGGEYRAVLTPALDDTNETQFRGCVEDWTIDHLRVDVLDLEEIEADEAEADDGEADEADEFEREVRDD